MDIYSIGLKVDSRQVKAAQKDLGGMGRQAKQTGSSVSAFGQKVDKSSKSVSGISKATDIATRAVAALGAAMSLKAFQQFATTALQSARNIQTQSRALGVSADEFQRLSFAFRQFGADSSDISDALNTLADRAEDAKAGMQSFIDDFKLVGIEVDDLRGKDPDELFRLFASQVASIEDPTRRAAGVVRILGDDVGRKLLPLLQQGEEGLDRLGNQAEIASGEVIESSARIQRDLTELGTQLETGLQNVFLSATARNEEQIRSLVATTLRGIGTIVQYGDELAGPVGAGILGRVLVGKKTGAILAAVTGTVQIVNTIIDRLNQTTGHELARVEQQIDDLVSKYEERGMEIPVGAQEHLDDLRERQEALSNSVVDSIDLQKDYNDQLENNKDVGEEAAKAIFDAADAFEQMPSVGDATPRITITGGQQAGPSPVSDELLEQQRQQERLLDLVEESGTVGEKAFNKWQFALKDVADTVQDDISSGLTDIIMQAEDAKDVFIDLANQIARTITQQQIADPLAEGITDFAVDSAGSLFSGGAGSTSLGGGAPPNARGIGPQSGGGGFFSGIGDFFGGFFANGGNVSGGQAHVVGERGPEMFVPRQDGQIVPNSQMGGGGGDVTVNIINQSGEQLQSEQQNKRRGPNGEMTVDVMVKSSMERLDSQGQLDGIFRRHGAKRQGQF